MRALILSDGRVGHENQSIAFCKLKNIDYGILHVSYKLKILKTLSYILDFFGIYIKIFSSGLVSNSYDIVVGAGSGTYYPLKFYAKKLNAKSVAMMNAKGYKNSFDLMFVMSHDAKNLAPNSILLPVNANHKSQNHFYKPSKPAISFIIGGTNKNSQFDEAKVLQTIKEIMSKFKDHEKLITTSPRTPKSLENELEKLNFDYSVIYSKNKINPIDDFLEFSDYTFITSDSTSMISQAVCWGNANAQVINYQKDDSKFGKFISNLAKKGYLHIYDGSVQKTTKFDLISAFKKVNL
ncbi:mitochondrial fission domain protein [Campylobacter iguaniorum]|uniref:ELM1/GtrOC1 family putative glycosyltransferase n=1 Tax=Campylobacter iguaniorum TaxID=1244531 RepID=UPI0007C892AC|nr:ELM1/GtrOC1 family putative glycosyltransferase [Campylobacter iguaniorum]ANE36353.1 mitochondrial fission domain protein [Campylobacter iguaniorum]